MSAPVAGARPAKFFNVLPVPLVTAVMRRPLAVAFLVHACLAFAQSPRTFEVSTVKPSRPEVAPGVILDGAHFSCSGVTLLGLMLSAWRIPASRISGAPGWATSDLWDIAATMPPNMPTERQALQHETEPMLRALIEDRFKLTTHRETREQSAYALVVSKRGLRLKPSEAASYSSKPGSGHIELRRASMAILVSYLYTPQANGPQPVDRPVVDETGLTELFDVTLDWSPGTDGPSLFTALEEQAGLRLEARKLPLEFLVVDHVEKPGEN